MEDKPTRGPVRELLDYAKDQLGEPITHVVIGLYQEGYTEHEKGLVSARWANRPLTKVAEIAEALETVDSLYSGGYGHAKCPPVYAYTESYIIVVSEYDGSTGLKHFPRRPARCTPHFA